MALILEVLSAGRHAEVRERHRLDHAALAIGRGLDNQVVLDDPHVDARHARLEPQEDGSWVLVDLGSVNRIGLPRDGRTERLVVAAGTIVTLGRTTLRFRDEFAPVPSAVPLRPAAAERGGWLSTARGRAVVIVGAMVIGVLHSWLGMTTRGAASQVFTELMVAMVLLAMWAGTWAIASRVVLGRFNFLSHVAIGAVAVVVLIGVSELASWTRFLFPALTVTEGIEGFAMVGLVATLVALHLSAASHLPRALRWRAGAVAAGVIIALAGISAALDDDAYTPEAKFSGDLKMLLPALVPTQDPAAFTRARAELKDEVDALLEERQ